MGSSIFYPNDLEAQIVTVSWFIYAI